MSDLPESGHSPTRLECLLSANHRHGGGRNASKPASVLSGAIVIQLPASALVVGRPVGDRDG